MIIVDVLALATTIGACAIATLLAKNKYQPVMEAMWENRNREKSREQINELREIGKRFSPAFDTLTNGTSVVLV